MTSLAEPTLRRLIRPRRSLITARYLGTRTLHSLIAVLGAFTIVFFLVFATGNPARMLLPPDATVEQIERISRVYGFDEPIFIQYIRFIGAMLTGEFPDSIRYSRPAIEVVLERVPATLQLSGISIGVGLALGLLLGFWLASTQRRLFANTVFRGVVIIQSIPSYLLGIILVLIFAITLRWLPSSGYSTYWHLVLPVTVYAAYIAPGVARVFRSSLLEQYQRDHVVTAVATGASPRQVRIRHVAVNSLGTVITYIGLEVGGILGGAVITESVFAYPGVGQLLVSSISSKDIPVTLAAVLLIAIGYVLVNFVVDLLLPLVDPRTQLV